MLSKKCQKNLIEHCVNHLTEQLPDCRGPEINNLLRSLYLGSKNPSQHHVESYKEHLRKIKFDTYFPCLVGLYFGFYYYSTMLYKELDFLFTWTEDVIHLIEQGVYYEQVFSHVIGYLHNKEYYLKKEVVTYVHDLLSFISNNELEPLAFSCALSKKINKIIEKINNNQIKLDPQASKREISFLVNLNKVFHNHYQFNGLFNDKEQDHFNLPNHDSLSNSTFTFHHQYEDESKFSELKKIK